MMWEREENCVIAFIWTEKIKEVYINQVERGAYTSHKWLANLLLACLFLNWVKASWAISWPPGQPEISYMVHKVKGLHEYNNIFFSIVTCCSKFASRTFVFFNSFSYDFSKKLQRICSNILMFNLSCFCGFVHLRMKVAY